MEDESTANQRSEKVNELWSWKTRMTERLKISAWIAGVFGFSAISVLGYLQNEVNAIDDTIARARGAAIEAIGRAEQKALDRISAERLKAIPVGTVVAYSGSLQRSDETEGSRAEEVEARFRALEEEGWLLCDGRPLQRSEYPKLWQSLGTAHGTGVAADGTRRGDFNLPDYRGLFLRGVSMVTDNDPDKGSRSVPKQGGNSGNRVGSLQSDGVARHRHGYSDTYRYGNVSKDPGPHREVPRDGRTENKQTDFNAGALEETRPKNVYVYYLIKSRLAEPKPDSDGSTSKWSSR